MPTPYLHTNKDVVLSVAVSGSSTAFQARDIDRINDQVIYEYFNADGFGRSIAVFIISSSDNSLTIRPHGVERATILENLQQHLRSPFRFEDGRRSPRWVSGGGLAHSAWFTEVEQLESGDVVMTFVPDFPSPITANFIPDSGVPGPDNTWYIITSPGRADSDSVVQAALPDVEIPADAAPTLGPPSFRGRIESVQRTGGRISLSETGLRLRDSSITLFTKPLDLTSPMLITANSTVAFTDVAEEEGREYVVAQVDTYSGYLQRVRLTDV